MCWKLQQLRPGKTGHERGARAYIYFFFSSDFFEVSDFEVSDLDELSLFEEESSDLDFESLDPESPFEELVAEPVEDFLA
jgi:hypothetical protein